MCFTLDIFCKFKGAKKVQRILIKIVKEVRVDQKGKWENNLYTKKRQTDWRSD